jgi:hypothetical protein
MATLPGLPVLRTNDSFFRRFVLPEEEKQRITSVPWRGEFRWFCSSNVVPLERYRTPDEWRRVCAALLHRR